MFTAKGTMVFGFACDGPGAESARLVFVTSESTDDGTLAVLNMTKPKLSIIIDNGERSDLDATLDGVDMLGVNRLRVYAVGEQALALVSRIAAAKSRVSVALSTLGQVFHPTNFGVRGSGRVLAKALATCGLQTNGQPS